MDILKSTICTENCRIWSVYKAVIWFLDFIFKGRIPFRRRTLGIFSFNPNAIRSFMFDISLFLYFRSRLQIQAYCWVEVNCKFLPRRFRKFLSDIFLQRFVFLVTQISRHLKIYFSAFQLKDKISSEKKSWITEWERTWEVKAGSGYYMIRTRDSR